MNSPSTATPTKPVVQEATATKPETVRAVAMTSPGQTEMRTYPYPTMDHDSAILKVDMAGICGTDRHIYKGEATELRGKSIFPYVGGHEVIGTIVEIGDNAAKVLDYDKQPLAVGDRVALAVEVNCGHCVYCRKHYNNTTCLNQIQAYGLHPNCETNPTCAAALQSTCTFDLERTFSRSLKIDADRHRRLRRRNGGSLSFGRSSCRSVRASK